jgi:hypothetical protein
MPIGNKIKNGNDLYLAFIKGYPLDFSTSTMLVLIPMLVALIYYIFHIEGIKNTLPKVIIALLILYIAVSLSDAGLYREWNAKINMQALEHFQNPSEVLKTISVKLLIIYFVLLVGLSYLFLFIYKSFEATPSKLRASTLFSDQLLGS